MSTPSTSSRPSAVALATLFGSSAATAGLAVYQWVELLAVRNGVVPACAVNDTINCATVWNSPFASRVHETVGMPVAALGVLWGVVGFLLALFLWQRAKAAGEGGGFTAAVKLWAWAGVLACVTFITASVQAKALCLTCMGTYALTAAYAVGALKLLGGPAVPSATEFVPGAGWVLVLMAPVYLGLLYPGSQTPQSSAPGLKQRPEADLSDVGSLIASMPERDRAMVAYARAQWLHSEPKDVSRFATRARRGPADAPVKIVDFTDILCGHCGQFELMMGELERGVPPGRFSIEPRYYPLDSECNPEIPRSAGDGIRCFGAKLQICLETHPRFFDIRHELFLRQQGLDQRGMLEVAAKYGVADDSLRKCMMSEDTAAKLREDIAYAKLYGIQGTPLVLLNGREAPPAAVFILGMVMSGGDANAPYFQNLPPPPAMPSHGDHEH